MDASFLIPMQAGANGAKGTDPTAPEAAKGESSGEPSFGVVMTQVSDEAAAKAGEAGPGAQPDQATPSASETGLLASLQMAFVGQIPTATGAPSQPSPDGQTAALVDGAASGAAASALFPALPDSARSAGDAASLPFMTASAASALPGDTATLPGTGTAAAGLTDMDQTRLTPEGPGKTPGPDVSLPAAAPDDTPMDATAVRTTDPSLGGDGERVLSDGALRSRPEPGQAGSDASRGKQELASITTVADDGEALTAKEVTAGPKGEPEGLPAEPLGMPGAQQEAGSQTGDAGGEGSGQPQPAMQQDAALREQASQLSGARQDKPGSAERKNPNAALSPASERLGISMNEPPAFRQEEIVKVAAVAPVTPPSEAPASPSVQALSLEVERPGIGQVALRVVLADQTVHAKVTTDHVEVRDFLVTRQGQLEAGLKASGLDMGEFRVDVNQHRQGQADSGWAGAYRDAWGQGRQQGGQPAPDAQAYLTPDAWSGEAGTADDAWQTRSLSVFA